ncbi:hybrid sensor histidine kinase/response regulator transcription factor [Hymenobacter coccineus]|uniref:histidine kinase n=1 Tax=Hymenobacter coccineus TaxID=1908235 RepID=A0A1G1SWU7_9BACT|nr:two-component regulator propeller domain-containing protein [Hymenobacter coccineus]OGX83088.1 hybrid sensor histidine kinase/response regulator [Hymenobacter coccineus]
MQIPLVFRWLLVLWAGLLAPAAQAQDVALSDFRFEHITVDQGLSHSDAMAVAQDRAGFLWIGTNRGLNRYDGYSLKPYMLATNPRNGMSGNRITALLVGPDERLWVGTELAGLSYYDAAHDAFRHFDEHAAPPADQAAARLLTESDVTVLTLDNQHHLWVGTIQHGIFVLTFGPQGRVLTLRQLPPTAAGRPALLRITSLAVDAERNVWAGTLGAGLVVIRTAEPAWPVEATGFASKHIASLCLDQRGDLWVGAERQVYWVPAANRRTGRELAAHPLPQQFPRIQALHLDSAGRLWVGTLYGLYVWEAGAPAGGALPLQAGRPTLFLPQDGEPFSINSERVHHIFEDRNQTIWLCASAGGLNKVNLRQRAFGQLRRQLVGQLTLSNNYINTIYKEEATNTLWFGTRNGVAAYNLVRHTYRNYFNQQEDATRGVDVSTIFKAADGTLWFGTRSSGLLSLKRTGGREKLTRYTRLPTGFDLTSTSIEHLAQDGEGTLWVATFSAGLLRLGPSGQYQGTYDMARNHLPTNQFTHLLYDPARRVLWASTRNAGLLKLRPAPGALTLLHQYQYAPGQPNGLDVNYVWPLLLDRQGALWIGTIGGGLHQLRTDAQGHETMQSFVKYLPESDVESLLPDDAGNLWIGGTGLYRFTPSTRRYLRYDVADGLQSNAFKIGAAARAQDGTLYFGGINGINYFQPAAIQANPTPPVVQLTGLRVMNRPVGVGQVFNGRVLLTKAFSEPQTVTIRAAENDFSVEFVALNYTNPQKNHYAYRLRGYNQDWVRPGPGQRTASFANLPPGRYTLEVTADNGEGAWARQLATMQFDVLAPWYKTGWAYLFYALVLLGVIVLYRRFEIAQQGLRNKLALEQFQAEKEKELTNLKLGFFTNVSHELRTPLTLILGPMEEIMGAPGPVSGMRDKVQLMHRQTRKLLDLVNQLLDFRKVESGNVPLRASYGNAVPLLTDIFRAFEQKAAERRLTYSLDVPAEAVPLYFDRSKLEIILTNLVANAFKYTPAGGRIELAATVVGSPGGEAVFEQDLLIGNYLEISVLDSGTGIRAEELGRIFDPYYQASHTDTLRMTGTGIGLSLVKQFAERHAGTIAVESTVGAGTAFRLRLPFGQAHLHPADILPETEQPDALDNMSGFEASELPLPSHPAAQTTRPRLLVVEDNDEVRQYLQQLFEADYEVLAAADGQEGWEQVLARSPDLVVSDVMMPRSDGLELCQRIRQHPKTAHIPVLLLTARTAALHEVEGLETGADDYVSKPFNPLVLQAKAATLLRNRLKMREFYQRQILLEPNEIVIADADRAFLEQAMRAVEQHLEDPTFGVVVLANDLCLSQSVLYRRIKSITGQTTVEFIRDVRMKRAAQLLTHSQLRITEIAFQVGVENVKYFRKTFQKIYGMAPSEYAKQHRPDREAVVAEGDALATTDD